MKASVLWASLTNKSRSIEIPSGDWERILFKHGNLCDSSEERWSGEDRSWLWTDKEANALSEALETAGSLLFIGSLMVDLDYGIDVRGTGADTVDDGLTLEQRKIRLVQFLREGSFRWKFISRNR